MASLRTLPLLLVVALSACPGSEVGDADTGVKPADADAGSSSKADTGTCAISVAGTYDVIWTGAAANAAGCPAPMNTIEVLADGLDTGSPASSCQHSACTTATCVRAVLDSSCAASMVVTGPCAGLAAGRILSAKSTFSGTKANFELSDTMTTAGACAFTGVGTKR